MPTINYEKIGKRFHEIVTKLDNLGVFYGRTDLDAFEDKYPHELYWFTLYLDKHRDQFTSVISGGIEVEQDIAEVEGKNPVDMILELLEKSHENIIKVLNTK
jgi:hypothetical protein